MTEPLGADVDLLLMDILRPAVPDGVLVQETMPPNYTAHYPLVRARRPPGGGGAVDPRWLDIASVTVDVFDDDRGDAFTLARICRAALFNAWTRQTVYANGSISSYEEQSAPADFRLAGQPDGETHIQATYRLGVCPP